MMDLEANTSYDSNHESTNGKQDARKQQFTTKQRMDMYAFCVLELELHGNTVSIKKQQQAIQRALKKDRGAQHKSSVAHQPTNSLSSNDETGVLDDHQNQREQTRQNIISNSQALHPETSNNHPTCPNSMTTPDDQTEQLDSFPQHEQQADPSHRRLRQDNDLSQRHQESSSMGQQQCDADMQVVLYNGGNNSMTSKGKVAEKKTLLELQEEIAKTQRCYSDYQKTQVLTSSMLREVQRRFAKYYPDTPCPSRTTIKHVFLKCVENGTVENIKNPRKPTKIPNGDQIEQFLILEPQMSLREMAKKLNVSTGTVSRRCRALGIVPESVTLKHQQMAMAKRQKQMKKMSNKTKSSGKRSSAGSSRQQQQQQQQATLNHHDQSQYSNGFV